MPTDGGSHNPDPKPDGSGTQPGQGGDSGSVNATAQIPAELLVVAERLGVQFVPKAELADLKKVHGSVKHGNILEKLTRLNKLEEADKKRQDGELSDLERATGTAELLEADKVTLAARNSELALRVGFLIENLKLAHSTEPGVVAVIPAVMEANWGLLAEFKGGDVDEFVKSGLGKMLDLQTDLARQLGGGAPNAPGATGPASPSGAQSALAPRKTGSVVKQLVNWRDEVATTHNPHIVRPEEGGGKR